jgi:hypothetical protein
MTAEDAVRQVQQNYGDALHRAFQDAVRKLEMPEQLDDGRVIQTVAMTALEHAAKWAARGRAMSRSEFLHAAEQLYDCAVAADPFGPVARQ